VVVLAELDALKVTMQNSDELLYVALGARAITLLCWGRSQILACRNTRSPHRRG
jgi:hypothetical protein